MYMQILRSTNGQFFARIRAANHQTLFVSETYVSKQDAINAAHLVKANAYNAPVYDATS